jgi:hypothetical protein
MKKDRFLEKLKDAISTNTSEFSEVKLPVFHAGCQYYVLVFVEEQKFGVC